MNWTVFLIIIVCISSAYIGYVGLTLIRMMERLEGMSGIIQDIIVRDSAERKFHEKGMEDALSKVYKELKGE